MKKIIGICLVVVLVGVVFVIKKDKEPILELENAKFITKENNDLNVYEYIHELTHSFINTEKKDIKIIAPTKEARNLGSELSEKELYGKGDMDTYNKIGYMIEKIKYGLIDSDIINLHNILAEKLGEKDCVAKSLNINAIEKIVNDDRFFDSIDRENYKNRNEKNF